MRTEAIAQILENRYIEKVILSENKTKNVFQWKGYLNAKLKEIRYE